MMAGQESRLVFTYAYCPVEAARSANDGGFTVNLMENGLLMFDVYDRNMQVVCHYTFPMPQEAVYDYCRAVRHATRWLQTFPLHMGDTEHIRYVSRVGLDGLPEIYRINDLPQLVNCPFGTMRGHYARMMYNLLEDISGMMARYGISFSLDSFAWQAQQIRPLEDSQPMAMFG